MNNKSLSNFFFAILFLCLIISNAQASDNISNWEDFNYGKVRLLVNKIDYTENSIFYGIQFKLKENWKVFWKSPGDAGYSPKLLIDNSVNIYKPIISWPVPSRFETSGLLTYGYREEVLLPIKAKIYDENKDSEINFVLDFLICDAVCIPKEVKFELNINKANKSKLVKYENVDYLFNKYEKLIPKKEINRDLFIKSAAIGLKKNKHLVLNIFNTNKEDNLEVFIGNFKNINFGFPESIKQKKENENIVRVPFSYSGEINDFSLLGKRANIIVKVGDQIVEKDIDITFENLENIINYSYPLILLLAFLGGVILNFMPCVLPVLSIKLMGFKNENNFNKKSIQINIIFTILGILLSFLSLALLITIAKFAGQSVGWGFHFQQPLFILAMIVIITLFIGNTLGFFNINISNFISTFSSYSDNKKYEILNPLFSGVLITILATPCTAPIIGTVVGFAITSSLLSIYLIFLFMGLGMSLIYIVFLFFPGIIFKLPRSNKIGRFIKLIIILALIGTLTWLLIVFYFQVGVKATLIVLISIMLILILLKGLNYKFLNNITFKAISIVLLVFVGIFSTFNYSKSIDKVFSKDIWVKFDEAKIQNLVNKGNIVFVDITAEWCVTCKYNKIFILDRPKVKELFKRNNVVTMRGDWTNPNSDIFEYLKQNNRAGIPFNIVYGYGVPKGFILGEVLNIKDIQKIIKIINKKNEQE